ncbi:hypothetical protein [Paraburkholderia phenoliruptrix]|uniref:PRC-barrel domain-containing protein n=2 Tax=Paraburkholderia phenoliruptrix TaxID=252970 RepID=A0A6J5KC95_9BURK|nr:hypothetical protein [Paraburkholderia phenoliruptrix]AFT89502.1 hypothetical protein BUPH_05587 [Paraburkholderia phenoliruptrix BR3459a]MDR6421839.1 hypothetical protein [Paraburkholderia phenoliruptrix]WMY10385.1 hypothetical protein P3F88_27165 [Paraburkholderia phenoliruptrix]CAB3656011.1 hypothetical protein LMG22037_01231 [Paraburkholderia phenoliruptrix]CAB4050555.1 hypothetical protein LMG9964_04221 [Paraburkholderia phenoliruptrix]
MTQLNIELLLGREVRSRDGKRLGHIEAIHAVRDGESWIISEFHIGPDALLERLAVGLLPRRLREMLQHRRDPRRHRLAWDQMDLSDARHPRLTCDEASLQKAHAQAGEK